MLLLYTSALQLLLDYSCEQPAPADGAAAAAAAVAQQQQQQQANGVPPLPPDVPAGPGLPPAMQAAAQAAAAAVQALAGANAAAPQQQQQAPAELGHNVALLHLGGSVANAVRQLAQTLHVLMAVDAAAVQAVNVVAFGTARAQLLAGMCIA